MDWQLQDAKNQFSKVVQKARHEGPQEITVRGERTAVVLSARDYDALLAGGRHLSMRCSAARSGTMNS